MSDTPKTGLLVSVRSADEADAALAGGADLIDCKEPARGPLGVAEPEVVAAILDRVAGQDATAWRGPVRGALVAVVVTGAVRVLGLPVVAWLWASMGWAWGLLGLMTMGVVLRWPVRSRPARPGGQRARPRI